MTFRMPGATAIAALMLAVAAPAPLAFAQNGAPAVTVSRDLVQPLNDARNAIIAKDWATAKAKLDAATPKAKTPADKSQLERMRLAIAAETKDGKQQIASINMLIASGTLTPDEVKQYKGALAKAHAEAGDSAASLVAFRAYVDEYGGTPDQLIAIANDSAKANDNATAIAYANKAIDAKKATGAAPDESWYRFLANSYVKQKMMPEFYAVREATLTAHPASKNAEQYWKELVVRAQDEPNFDRDGYLDLYRTLMAAGVKLTADEKGRAIREALVSRGLPNEALQLLEPAIASGELSSQEDKDNLAKAKSRIAEDKSSLAKETKDALAKNDTSYIAKLGEAHMSYGDNAKAIEVLQAALAKGIADAEEAAFAQLHLGIAQFRAGQADAARVTWAEVKSDNGATMLAKNWTLISKLKT